MTLTEKVSGELTSLTETTPTPTPSPTPFTCPEGYLMIKPADSYGLKEFCVMKYEAKAAQLNSGSWSIEATDPLGNYDTSTYNNNFGRVISVSGTVNSAAARGAAYGNTSGYTGIFSGWFSPTQTESHAGVGFRCVYRND